MLSGITIGAVTGGLFNRLITSGMQRVGSLIFQKALRISRIEQAVRAGALKNPNVKAAINDFEVLIGNRYGEYVGIDGLTNLVLVAADRGIDRPEFLTPERALDALAAIGRRYSGGQLVKGDFGSFPRGSSAPQDVWKRILMDLKKSPEAFAGAFLIFLIIDGLAENANDNDSRIETEVTRNDIVKLFLNTKAVKQLASYPQIAAAASNSIFA